MTKPKKKKRVAIGRKNAFKETSTQWSASSLGGGEATGSELGLPNIRPWPARDETPFDFDGDEKDRHLHKLDKTGRTLGDVFRELFVEGQIEVLLIIAIGALFVVFVWQDNAAGRWETSQGIYSTFKKTGFCILFCLVLYGFLKFSTRKKKR